MRPLDDEQLKRILSCWNKLLEYIECDGGLLVELFSRRCLTRIQKMYIEEHRGTARTDLLLKFLIRGSIAQFNEFMKCLAITGQHHVVALLTRNSGMSINCSLTQGWITLVLLFNLTSSCCLWCIVLLSQILSSCDDVRHSKINSMNFNRVCVFGSAYKHYHNVIHFIFLYFERAKTYHYQ